MRYKNAHAEPALTKTAAPDPNTMAAVRSSKRNSNRARPTDGQIASPSPPSDPDSDIMLATSFVGNDGNSDYVESVEKSPTSLTNTPDLEGHISKLETMYEFSQGDINAIA